MFKLSEALSALEGRREFVVKRYRERLVCVNYLITLPDSFDGIRENFRGVTFDERTGEIISLPIHKFFNVDQRECTQWHLLKDLKADVYEKLDGSLIHYFREPTSLNREWWKIVGATRMSCETDQAKEATLMAMRNLDTWRLIEEHVDSGWTPMFEYVAPDNQIVVEYPKPRLVYLISRNRQTGEYKFDERFPDKAQKFSIPFSEIKNHLNKEEFEGYVCHLENGLFVKLKGEWYLQKHHSVDVLMKARYLIHEVALDGDLDDVIANCPDRHRQPLMDIADEVAKDVLGLTQTLDELVELGRKHSVDKKTFVEFCKNNFSEYYFGGLMARYDGKPIEKFIKQKLMEEYREKYPKRLFAEVEET